jgi:hypothetical protein
MADDALKQALVTVDFKAGEMPTPAKLTGSVEQLRLAIAEIDRAIGDLYSQQGHIPALSQVLPSGPSLTRTVGASARINPRRMGRIRVTDREVVFAYNTDEDGGTITIDGSLFYPRRVFRLPYPPIQITSSEGAADFSFTTSMTAGNFTVGSPGGGYTDATEGGTGKIDSTKRQGTLGAVNATGKWHVSDDGVITLYDGLASGEAFKVTYTFDSIPTAYDGASFNVIPDFAQTGVLCTAALVSGTTYTLSLPTTTKLRGETLSSRSPFALNRFWTSSSARTDPMSGAQLELPHLMSTMTVGQVIPAGYLLLWDDTAQEVVEGITFKYASQTSVTAEGVTLTVGSARYRVVVAGTGLTGVVDHLSDSFDHHNHSGQIQSGTGVYMGHRVNHYDLDYLVDEGVTASNNGFKPSVLGPARNPHPQSLHRHGYQYGISQADPGNLDNALAGHLLLTSENREVAVDADSYSVYFGSTSGPRLRYDNGDDRLELTNKDLYVSGDIDIGDDINVADDANVTGKIVVTGRSYCRGGIDSGDDDAGRIKWKRLSKTLDNPAGGDTFYTFSAPTDFTRVLGIQLAVVDTAASPNLTFYMQSSDTEAAANDYLAVSLITYVAGSTSITVEILHGSDLDGLAAEGIMFYY